MAEGRCAFEEAYAKMEREAAEPGEPRNPRKLLGNSPAYIASFQKLYKKTIIILMKDYIKNRNCKNE